jgi:hypothetical protein
MLKIYIFCSENLMALSLNFLKQKSVRRFAQKSGKKFVHFAY